MSNKVPHSSGVACYIMFVSLSDCLQSLLYIYSMFVCVCCSSVHQRWTERIFGHSGWTVTGVQLSLVGSHSCCANHYSTGTDHKTEPFCYLILVVDISSSDDNIFWCNMIQIYNHYSCSFMLIRRLYGLHIFTCLNTVYILFHTAVLFKWPAKQL